MNTHNILSIAQEIITEDDKNFPDLLLSAIVVKESDAGNKYLDSDEFENLFPKSEDDERTEHERQDKEIERAIKHISRYELSDFSNEEVTN